jgi:hypothetical protein
MKSTVFVYIDWDRGVWAMRYRDTSETITETTNFPASTPSIVVCDEVQKRRPGSRILAQR